MPRSRPSEAPKERAAEQDSGSDIGAVGQALVTLAASIPALLAGTREAIASLTDRVATLHGEIDRVARNDELISSLERAARELRERFHEREVARPLFLSLIGIADSAREQVELLQANAAQHDERGSAGIAQAIRQLVKLRKADILEIESALQTFGVERFHSSEETFSPATQTCIGHLPSANDRPHGQIAARLRPGYRRHDTILRPETVKIYKHHTGDKSPRSTS